MDRVRSGYSATTADPSTALRSGRDDKGRAVTFLKNRDWDGQSQERLLRDDADPLRYAPVEMTKGRVATDRSSDQGNRHCDLWRP
jgi:hypothetical protein